MNIYPPFISTCEECIRTLQNHGICAHISEHTRGAHGMKIWICNDYQEKFKIKILGNKLEGEYHNFFFSPVVHGTVDSSAYGFYYVSFRKK